MSSRKKLLMAAFLTGLVASGLFIAKNCDRIKRRFDMQGLRVVVVARGLEHPWSLAFLPSGFMLVTERPGRVRLVSPEGLVGAPLEGLPPVHAEGEGGLMDVVLDPAFKDNARIFWSYSEPAPGGQRGASTAVARARLDGQRLVDVQVIFRQFEKPDSPFHFGSRLLFAPDGRLFVGLGDRGQRDNSQRLDSLNGKIVRIEPDGKIPTDNPFVGTATARGEIWTLGNRNVQGMAWQPQTGELWEHEHGPQGGDELNVITKGSNYGWPVVTYGREYGTGTAIGEGTEKPGVVPPITWWGPRSIAPSGMVFLTSDRYPGWRGQMFIGTLATRCLLRIKLDGHRVVEQQELLTPLRKRIRDVRQGPDGWLYVLTDESDGEILRIER